MFSFPTFLASATIEAMDTTTCTSLSKLRCNLTTYPQNTKHACHQCAYKIFSADCRRTFQRSTKHVQTTTQNSFQHISLLYCALLILMNVFIKENSFSVIRLAQNPSQPMAQMPKYLMKEGGPTGLSIKTSQNTILFVEHQQRPQGIDSFKEEHPQAANAKDAACHFSFNPKQ